jgi:CCR4-NOT transcription complex subunit 6
MLAQAQAQAQVQAQAQAQAQVQAQAQAQERVPASVRALAWFPGLDQASELASAQVRV